MPPRTIRHLRQVLRTPETEEPANPSSCQDELAVALHAIDDFGRAIQSADAKAAGLTALLGLVTSGAVSCLDAGVVITRAWDAIAVPFIISLVVAVTFLGMTQLPRLTATMAPSRLAFPSAARQGCRDGQSTTSGLRDEAWSQAEVLAVIALRKHQYLRIALVATGACVATALCWICLVVL